MSQPIRLHLPGWAFALFLFLPLHFAGAQIVWNSTVSGDWSDTTKWSPARLPAASDGSFSIGQGATVTVTTSGNSAATNGQVYIGEFADGGLTLAAGGSLTTSGANTYVGKQGTGTITIDGGSWNMGTGGLNVGYTQGMGILVVNSGSLTNGFSDIGLSTAATVTSTATVNGGTWTSTSGLRIGDGSPGLLTITGGSVISGIATVGFNRAGTAIVSGGSWTVATSFVVGQNNGAGSLILSNSGIVNAGNGTGTITLGATSASQGNKLEIGNNTAFTGALQVGAVNGGSGTGKIVFSQTNGYSFTPNITGRLSLEQNGSGITTLTGTNTYNGGTTVIAGTLLVNHAAGTGSGPVGVKIGGVLGGTGSVTGAITVESGGTLAPGSSTFTANGGISLLDGAKFQFQLGTGSDLITDNGALSLGQNITFTLSPGAGFAAGQYTLVQFTGALTDNSQSFTGWNVTGLPDGSTAQFTLGASALSVTVTVPEPVTGTIFALGLTSCLMASRRRAAW